MIGQCFLHGCNAFFMEVLVFKIVTSEVQFTENAYGMAGFPIVLVGEESQWPN